MNKRRPDRDPELVRKVIVIVSIALALLVTLICIVDVILIRRRLASRPTAEVQVVQPATAEPKSIPTMAPPTQAPPVVEVVPTVAAADPRPAAGHNLALPAHQQRRHRHLRERCRPQPDAAGRVHR